MTPAAVRRQIRDGRTDAIYLLQGDDEIEKAALAHEFEEAVEEELRAFNVDRIHPGDLASGDKLEAAVASVVTAARTLPMMAPRRIVLVLHAERLLVPRRESDAAGRALGELEALLKRPEALATLVFVAAALDKRSRMYKLLLKHGTIVDCGVIEDVADGERWIRNRISAAGVQIAPSAARLLAERCGTDVRRLRNDVERLLLYALGQKTIAVEDVRQIAGPAALQDDWAMANAIEAGDAATALRQLALMIEAGVPPEKILGQIGWLVRAKLSQVVPAALPSAVEAVFRTDLNLKRSAGDPRILLERLVVELCAGKRARATAGRV